MDAAAELGRNSVCKHQIQPEYGDEQADAGRDRRTNPSRETKFSGANADSEIFIFPVQLTTCRIGNLTRMIHNLGICVTIHTYILYVLSSPPSLYTQVLQYIQYAHNKSMYHMLYITYSRAWINRVRLPILLVVT